MTAAKTLFLALAVLALPQAAAPGGVDDLAELFAEDTMVFAEVTQVSRLVRDWKDYAGAYMPADKKKELLGKLDKGMQDELGKVPELLRKDLEKALPTIQRAAVGVRMGHDGPEWAVAAASSDPAIFKKIVDDDLKVFGAEEKVHGGVTARLIRKMGDIPLMDGLWFAAAGSRLIVTSQWNTLTALLDRAANKAAGTDLRINPTYRAFAAAAGDDPALRAFSGGLGTMFDAMGGIGMGRRSASHEMDKVNAVFGIDKIGGFLVEASLKPGKITSVARLRVGAPCALYDVWRQAPGPKDTLKYMPANAGLTAHVNAKGGKAVWADIQKLMARYEEVEAVASPAKEGRLQRGGMKEQMDREFERELGLKPDELFGAIGGEAAFGLVGPDALAFDPRMLGALLFVVKAADPATAKDTLKKLVAKLGTYETTEADGTTFHLPPADKAEMPRFAYRDGVCLIGGSKEAVEAGLAAAKSGKHAAAGLPPEAAKASKLLTLDLGAIWKSLVAKAGPDMPEEVRALEVDARSTVMFEEKDDELVLRSNDGTGLALQASWTVMPLAVLGFSRVMRSFPGLEVEEPEAVAPVVEGPPLPAGEVAAKVKALVQDLQADDVDKREEAAGRLRALGRQAVPPVVAAFKAAADAETRGRLLGLLMDWKAYDAMPEVLAKKVDAFLQGFRRAPNPNDQRGMMMNMAVQWYRHEGMPWTYCLEPSWVNEGVLKATPHLDVLQFAPGAKAAAEAAAAENTPVEPRRKLASILAYVDCGKAGDALVAARDAARDPEVKSYLQIALGWSAEPKCRAAVRDGFKDADVWVRRSSFIAAERSKDPAVVGRLLELLKDADPETRWNATYTLKSLTRRKVAVNIYAPKADVDAATEAAGAWWAKNKDTFKPGN